MRLMAPTTPWRNRKKGKAKAPEKECRDEEEKEKGKDKGMFVPASNGDLAEKAIQRDTNVESGGMLQTQKGEVQATSCCHITKTHLRIGYATSVKLAHPQVNPFHRMRKVTRHVREYNTELSLVAPFGNPSSSTKHSQISSGMARVNQKMENPAEKIKPPLLRVRSRQTEPSTKHVT